MQQYRRTFAIVAAVHLGVLLVFFVVAKLHPTKKPPEITWLMGGELGGGDNAPSADGSRVWAGLGSASEHVAVLSTAPLRHLRDLTPGFPAHDVGHSRVRGQIERCSRRAVSRRASVSSGVSRSVIGMPR